MAFEKFINNIRPEDSVAVIHHTDCDGICSGFIVRESLKRLKKEVIYSTAVHISALNSGLVNKLKQKKITKVIFTDLIADQIPGLLDELKFAKVLVIDHHKPYESNERVIKPDYLGIDCYYPASKLVYDLFSSLVNISDLDWVSAVGLVGDAGYPQSKKFVDEVMKKYKIAPKEDIFETKLGEIAKLINNSGDIIPNKIQLAIRTLRKAKSPDDMFAPALMKVSRVIEKEINKEMNNFRKNAERYDDLLFYEIKTQYHIRGAVITRLGFEITDKTLIIIEKDKDKYTASARRQDGKVKVNELLASATEGFGNGGGHDKAAGASFLVKDLAKFKENLLRK